MTLAAKEEDVNVTSSTLSNRFADGVICWLTFRVSVFVVERHTLDASGSLWASAWDVDIFVHMVCELLFITE